MDDDLERIRKEVGLGKNMKSQWTYQQDQVEHHRITNVFDK
jgi:hypothetical protein